MSSIGRLPIRHYPFITTLACVCKNLEQGNRGREKEGRNVEAVRLNAVDNLGIKCG